MTQQMPGRITQANAYDRAGQLAAMDYTVADGSGEQVPVAAWSMTSTTEGKTATVATTVGAGETGLGRRLAYAYDEADRLVEVEDVLGDGVCSTRGYRFDANGNRVGGSRTDGAVDEEGVCVHTHTVGKVWTYDAADRVTAGAALSGVGATGAGGGAYAYDGLGRQTTVAAVDTPAGTGSGDLTLGYYDTDAARTLTQDGSTTTYTLDPAGRRQSATTVADGQSTTVVRHYADASDNPAWAVKGTGSQAVTTWYGASVAGDLAVTTTAFGDGAPVSTVTLADPHGDIALTMPADALTTPQIIGASWYDEYGTTLTATTDTGAITYGPLGAKERAQDTTGLTLMGARLYNPVTGAFTSVDPVVGGNTTAYTYPQDPINTFDLDGKRSSWRWWLAKRTYSHVVSRAYRSSRFRSFARGANNFSAKTVGFGAAAYSRATGGYCKNRFGVRTCRGGWGHGYSRGGTTLGTTYITGWSRKTVTRKVVRHEAVHVRQWRTYGLSFPVRYFRAGSNPCRNRWEREAGMGNGGYTKC
ncbi:RHS repeat-associated core domain-containing protein [Paraoerskovia sediminicola]|uniref:RHS repeat-associated core domain-containing protein n=1 Tax=Paraoerskovia sediminicola TaxID=1138587 RepID=UPI00257410D8|nr:RHS repeat-associated core domain-containing protein [Paraoerskovia sediminicola]